MYLLISGATSYFRDNTAAATSPYLGHFISPRTWNRLDGIVSSGRPWAADNDCFQRLDRDAYVAMLRRIQGAPGCRFVSVPDVVANAADTMVRFQLWEPVVHSYGLPAALVAQDGLERMDVPWDRFEALFVGGSTAWKLGGAAAALILEAKARGKWVHMGRVNSQIRIWYAESLGVDSVDGTGWSKFPAAMIPLALEALTPTDAPCRRRVGARFQGAHQSRLFQDPISSEDAHVLV